VLQLSIMIGLADRVRLSAGCVVSSLIWLLYAIVALVWPEQAVELIEEEKRGGW